MTTPANDSQKNSGDKKEPKEKGGVVPTDAKRFNGDDSFKNDAKLTEEVPTLPKTD